MSNWIQNKTGRAALMILVTAGAALSGCGDGPDPGGGDDVCPAERSVRCPDDSCVADMAECPSEQPTAITGDIVGMQPTTILGHAPEPVALLLSVDEPARVQELLDDGASWRVRIETASGEETVDATGTSADQDSDAHDYRVEFTPSPEDGPQQAKLTLELVDGDGRGVDHGWAGAKLRYRGDATSLDFEGRESFPIDGLRAADRTWGGDLDGDGIDDLVVSDLETNAAGQTQSTLHLFKCGTDRCEPAGELSTTAKDGEQFVVPETMIAPDSADRTEPAGFLAAAVTARDSNGNMSQVEVIWAELVDRADGLSVRDTRVKFDLQRGIEGGELHEQTLMPRLLRNETTGDIRPGLTVTRTDALRGERQWSTLVMADGGVIAEYRGRRYFEGLDDIQTQAALDGELAVCLSGPSKTLAPKVAPQGMIVSAFDLDGSPAVAIAGIDDTEVPARVFDLGSALDASVLDGDYGSVSCELGDLDGDGLDDLAVSVAADDVYTTLGASPGRPASLFLAMGVEPTGDLPGRGEPTLVIEGIDASSRGFMKAGDELVLDVDISPNAASGRSFSISKRSARTGRNPQAKTDMQHDGQGNVRLSVQEVAITPPGLPVKSHGRLGEPTALGEGNDVVVRKKPGRTKYANITLERGVVGSTQLIGDSISPTLAHFGPGIGDADGDSDGDGLLQITDPESILGSIGTTGPFNPAQTSNGDSGQVGQHSDILYLPAVDDRTTPLLYQLKADPSGKPSQIVMREIVTQGDRVTLENEKTFDLDTSSVTLEEGKKVTKFKAGAELSKAVNAQAPDGGGDCDDTDPCPRPDEVLLAMQVDGGDVWTAVLDVTSSAAVEVKASTARDSLIRELGLDSSADPSGLRTSLRIAHVDGEPVALLAGTHLGGDLDEVDESFVTIDRDGAVSPQESLRRASTDPLTVFGDVLGAGSDQRVVCRAADSGALSCSVAELDAPAVTWTSEVEVNGDVKCVVDLDGDRCGDLVTSAGEMLSSRCDGSFEQAPVELGEWAAHMVCGDASGPNKAQDYNAARSNKPTSIKWDDGDDHDGPAVSFPFYDALLRPAWEQP